MRLRLFCARCDKEEPGLPVVVIDSRVGSLIFLTLKPGGGVKAIADYLVASREALPRAIEDEVFCPTSGQRAAGARSEASRGHIICGLLEQRLLGRALKAP